MLQAWRFLDHFLAFRLSLDTQSLFLNTKNYSPTRQTGPTVCRTALFRSILLSGPQAIRGWFSESWRGCSRLDRWFAVPAG
jgi:hypothetical protein